jgi:hypothetical protein
MIYTTGYNKILVFIIYTLHEILLEWWNRGGWDDQCMQHAWEMRNAYKMLFR